MEDLGFVNDLMVQPQSTNQQPPQQEDAQPSAAKGDLLPSTDKDMEVVRPGCNMQTAPLLLGKRKAFLRQDKEEEEEEEDDDDGTECDALEILLEHLNDDSESDDEHHPLQFGPVEPLQFGPVKLESMHDFKQLAAADEGVAATQPPGETNHPNEKTRDCEPATGTQCQEQGAASPFLFRSTALTLFESDPLLEFAQEVQMQPEALLGSSSDACVSTPLRTCCSSPPPLAEEEEAPVVVTSAHFSQGLRGSGMVESHNIVSPESVATVRCHSSFSPEDLTPAPIVGGSECHPLPPLPSVCHPNSSLKRRAPRSTVLENHGVPFHCTGDCDGPSLGVPTSAGKNSLFEQVLEDPADAQLLQAMWLDFESRNPQDEVSDGSNARETPTALSDSQRQDQPQPLENTSQFDLTGLVQEEKVVATWAEAELGLEDSQGKDHQNEENNETNFEPHATAPKPPKRYSRWTPEEDALLAQAVEAQGGPPTNWKLVSTEYFNGRRNDNQCKGRWKKHIRPDVSRADWTEEEDDIVLTQKALGLSWPQIAAQLPGRVSDQVRQRYNNCLDPTLIKRPFSAEERAFVLHCQRTMGNKWTAIAKLMPGRSENMVKNCFHNYIMSQKRKIRRQESLPVPVCEVTSLLERNMSPTHNSSKRFKEGTSEAVSPSQVVSSNWLP